MILTPVIAMDLAVDLAAPVVEPAPAVRLPRNAAAEPEAPPSAAHVRVVRLPPWPSLPCGAGGEVSPQKVDGELQLRTTVNLSCSYHPVKRLRVAVGVKGYPVEGQKRPWDPDFSVQASYDLGHRFSLEYGDWSGNRFDGVNAADLVDGSLSLVYRPALPKFDDDAPLALRSLNCTTGIGTTPLPRGGVSKVRATASCGLSPVQRLSVRGTLIAYPQGRQDPWEPDFTYTASYQATDRLAVGYANYAGNRWFWRDDTGSGGFDRGSFYVAYTVPLSRRSD